MRTIQSILRQTIIQESCKFFLPLSFPPKEKLEGKWLNYFFVAYTIYFIALSWTSSTTPPLRQVGKGAGQGCLGKMDWKMRVILKLKEETSITVMLMTLLIIAENDHFSASFKTRNQKAQ